MMTHRIENRLPVYRSKNQHYMFTTCNIDVSSVEASGGALQCSTGTQMENEAYKHVRNICIVR